MKGKKKNITSLKSDAGVSVMVGKICGMSTVDYVEK